MTTYRFEEIKRNVSKRVPCAGGCGKKLSRRTTFTMTLNPFNKNSDGTIRTRQDIHDALTEQPRAWEAVTDDQWCTPCATKADDIEGGGE